MSSSSTNNNRTTPRSSKHQTQRQFILPKHITASNGLTISRDLTRFLQCGNDLEVLILRGPADMNHRSSMSSINGGGGGGDPYLLDWDVGRFDSFKT